MWVFKKKNNYSRRSSKKNCWVLLNIGLDWALSIHLGRGQNLLALVLAETWFWAWRGVLDVYWALLCRENQFLVCSCLVSGDSEHCSDGFMLQFFLKKWEITLAWSSDQTSVFHYTGFSLPPPRGTLRYTDDRHRGPQASAGRLPSLWWVSETTSHERKAILFWNFGGFSP